MFVLASSVSKSLQYLTSTLTQGGKGGHLFKLTCSIVLPGARNPVKKYHWRVWEVLAVSGTHWVCPCTARVLLWSTLLRLQVSLQGNSLRWAMVCVHFPGLSHSGSGSQVLHKGTDSGGPVFSALPRSTFSGDQVFGECTLCRWDGASYHLLCPSHSVSWVHSRSGISGVTSVSSGELISGCDPPGGCQPFRIPGRLG